MITYAIGCPVGTVARGIPSLDVAISMMRDFAAYYEDEDDKLVRNTNEPIFDYVEDSEEKHWHTENRWGRVNFCVDEEERCDCCHGR